MPTAGYSGTPLIRKLGITPLMKILLINEPANYFELLQSDLSKQQCKKNEVPEFVHLFVKDSDEFEIEMKKLKPLCKRNPQIVIWVSWYKKSAKIPTDISEDDIRAYALQNALVDIKVCAVSEIWSGLKLVVPIHLRQK